MGAGATEASRREGRYAVKLAATAAVILVIGTAVSLGLWQLRRADEKAGAQAARDAAMTAAPVLLPTGKVVTAEPIIGRRVVAEGRFDPAATLLLDNRTHQGAAGFHVLTPMRLGDGRAQVMVLRGWVARDPRERTRSQPFRTPATPVRIEGLAERDLPQPIVLGDGGASSPADGAVVQRFDLAAWRAATGPAALSLIVRQTSDLDDGLVRVWAQPGSGVDKHYGYAVQWFALAAAAGAWWVWVAAATWYRPGRRGPT